GHALARKRAAGNRVILDALDLDRPRQLLGIRRLLAGGAELERSRKPGARHRNRPVPEGAAQRLEEMGSPAATLARRECCRSLLCHRDTPRSTIQYENKCTRRSSAGQWVIVASAKCRESVAHRVRVKSISKRCV